ncbi:hypothetical protein M2146_002582 [Lachnospiraceae bacterium PF1-22]
MKKELKTIEVFIAEDGEHFSSEERCLAHEMEIKKKAELVFKKEQVKKLIYEPLEDYIPCDGEEWMCEYEHLWYKVESMKDVELLIDAFQLNRNRYFNKKVEKIQFPTFIHIETEPQSLSHYPATLDDSFDYIQKLMDAAGYEVTFKKKDEKTDTQKTEIQVPLLLIQDVNGDTHILGSDPHDSLVCFDNSLVYQNLQNGDGSGEYGSYSFVTEDDKSLKMVNLQDYAEVTKMYELRKVQISEDAIKAREEMLAFVKNRAKE